MKRLGIEFMQVGSVNAPSTNQESVTQVTGNSTAVNTAPAASTVKNMVLEPSFEKDLLVLFPKMKVTGQKVQLTDSFSWLIEGKSTRVIATKTQLITAPIHDLSIAQKKQVWSTLSPLVVIDDKYVD
ncbi:hypothetical protein N9L48_05760 [Psychrosphaera sp.]|nr:hypothetical protein [Psychrosphaera sp.]